jgi:protein TonB
VGQRRRIQIVAVAVALTHAVVVLTQWHAFIRSGTSAPRALHMRFDAQMFALGPAQTRRATAASTHAPVPAPLAHPRASKPPTPAPRQEKLPRLHRDPPALRTNQTPHSELTQSPGFSSSPPSAGADTSHAGGPAQKSSSDTPTDMRATAETVTAPSFNASYLHNPPPQYPSRAQQQRWEGSVLLSVHVQANGIPDHVALLSSSGHAPLDDAAVEAVEAWCFVPAHRGDIATDGWVKVPVEFKLES